MNPIRSAGRSVVRRALLPLLVAAGTAALVAVDIRILAENSPNEARRVFVGQTLAALPSDWNVYVDHGLILAAPRAWVRAACVDLTCSSPDRTWLAIGPGSQSLTVTTWPGYEANTLARTRFIEGNLQTVRAVSPSAPGVAVELRICCVSWHADGAGGQYEARHLFVQLGTDLAGAVAAVGVLTPGVIASVSTNDMAIQDQVASHLALARDSDAVFGVGEVERVLQAGGWHLAEISTSDQSGIRTSTWLTDQRTAITLTAYPDAQSRRARDPNLARAPLSPGQSARGIGNVLLIANGGDAETRYRILRALDALVR